MDVYFEAPSGTTATALVTGAPDPETAYQAALTRIAEVLPSDQVSYEVSGTGQSPNDEGRYEFSVSLT
jgi:hypothetical protein